MNSVTQFPAVSSEEFYFKMLSLPVRDVANYASRTCATPLPIYNQKVDFNAKLMVNKSIKLPFES